VGSFVFKVLNAISFRRFPSSGQICHAREGGRPAIGPEIWIPALRGNDKTARDTSEPLFRDEWPPSFEIGTLARISWKGNILHAFRFFAKHPAALIALAVDWSLCDTRGRSLAVMAGLDPAIHAPRPEKEERRHRRRA
jgi:hypothetical protein